MSEEPQRLFSVSLRIMDAPHKHEEITATFGVQPTGCHKVGDIRTKIGKTWENDIWTVEAPFPRDVDLNIHLQWISDLIKPHGDFLRKLRDQGARIDVYCSFRTNTDLSGFAIRPERMVLFAQLEIPVEVSVMFLS
jgi:hypothetical protein